VDVRVSFLVNGFVSSLNAGEWKSSRCVGARNLKSGVLCAKKNGAHNNIDPFFGSFE
jgi:hypothetical protein